MGSKNSTQLHAGSALSRPATVPARSDTVLVTETKYDSLTGRASQTIDAKFNCWDK